MPSKIGYLTTALALIPVAVNGLCQKYVDAAVTAAEKLQASYFGADGTYGDQAVWIGAVDTWHLLRRTSQILAHELWLISSISGRPHRRLDLLWRNRHGLQRQRGLLGERRIVRRRAVGVHRISTGGKYGVGQEVL